MIKVDWCSKLDKQVEHIKATDKIVCNHDICLGCKYNVKTDIPETNEDHNILRTTILNKILEILEVDSFSLSENDRYLVIRKGDKEVIIEAVPSFRGNSAHLEIGWKLDID